MKKTIITLALATTALVVNAQVTFIPAAPVTSVPTTSSGISTLPSSPLVVPSGTTMYGTASPTVAQCNQLVTIALGYLAQRTVNHTRPVLATKPSNTDNTVAGVLAWNTSLIEDYIYTVGPLEADAQAFVYNSCVQGTYKTAPVVNGGPTIVSPS